LRIRKTRIFFHKGLDRKCLICPSGRGRGQGKTIVLDHRFPVEQADRFRSMAQELVASKVDAIVAVTELGAKEARQATSTIPIVVVIASDPVAAGLIASLAHPGGNVTGLSLMAIDLSGKRLAFLKEILPDLSRVTFMIDPKEPSSRRIVAAFTAAAKSLGVELRPVEVATPSSMGVISTLVTTSEDALIVGPRSMMFNERARIGAMVSARKLPTEVAVAEMVPYGPLLRPRFPGLLSTSC
jgi:putative tryptophan/tyrosine transport system substrate-binding protein